MVAFFCTLRKGKYYYLFYLAVDEVNAERVSAVISWSAVIKNADGATVFLDCEGIYPGCKDRAARVKRLCFYHRNGFKEIGPLKTWRGEKFRTLVYGNKEFPSRKSKISGRFSVIYGRGRRLPPFLLRRVHRMGNSRKRTVKCRLLSIVSLDYLKANEGWLVISSHGIELKTNQVNR